MRRRALLDLRDARARYSLKQRGNRERFVPMQTALRMSGVYAIRCRVDGRTYIGSSVNVTQRWREHISRLRNQIHGNRDLQSAWNLYGERAFEMVLMELIANRDDLIAREQWHIDMNVGALFNVSSRAGSGPKPGYKHKPESIEKMRRASTGRRLSIEARARISAARRGRSYPKPNQRGKRWSAETRAKMSAAHKGRVFSPETRARLSAALKGRIRSPEHCAHIAQAKKCVPWSVRRREAFHEARL